MPESRLKTIRLKLARTPELPEGRDRHFEDVSIRSDDGGLVALRGVAVTDV